jgi:hypothetical protein
MKRRAHEPTPVQEPVNVPDRETMHEPQTEIVDLRSEICAVIDSAIVSFQGRSLLSGPEVVDFLLDLRSTVEIELQVALVPATAAR